MNKNFSAESVQKIIKNKDTDALISALSDEDRKLLDSLLQDENKRKEFLSSKKAQAIISTIFKGR